MTVFSPIITPYPIFTTISGAPLTGGLIYIGLPGLEARSSPKASFFDAAGTVPTGTATGAAVRTSGGFASYNGAPRNIFVDGDFSITVTDKFGAVILSDLNSNWILADALRAGEATAFASRAAAIAAIIPTPITAISFIQNGVRLDFVADAAGTALTTAGARKWSPAGVYTPLHYGAVNDGLTASSTAFSTWLADGLSKNAAMQMPAGDYLLDTAVVASVSTVRFAIMGSGTGSCRLIIPATNAIGGILITSSSRTSIANFKGFSIVRRGAGGTGLQFTTPEGGNQHQVGLTCQDVAIYGENGTTDYFATCANFAGTWRPEVIGCQFGGPFIGVDNTDASPRFSSDINLNLDGCYDATVDRVHCWAAKTSVTNRQYEGVITGVTNVGGGVVRLTLSTPHPFSNGLSVTVAGTTNYNGTFTSTNSGTNTIDITAAYVSSQTGTVSSTSGSEAVRITNSILAECKTALVYTHPNAREPIIWFTNNHVNYRDNGLRIDGAKLVTITGNHLYNQDAANDYAGTSVDVFLKNASEYVITGNTLHYAGAVDRIGVFVESETTGEGDNGLISSNIFSGTFAYAVWLSANVTGAIVGPNIYSGIFATAIMNDVSTSNDIVDGKTETTGTWTPDLTFGGLAVGMTYGSRSGSYRIVGGVLHYEINITLTAKGSSTGIADISLPTGLPGVRTIQIGGQSSFPTYSGMATIAGPSGRVTSAANLRLSNQGAAAISSITDANFTNTSSFTITGTLLLA